MTPLTCPAVRRRLAEYHDDELPLQERIAVQSHLNGCGDCTGALDGLFAIGSALRLAAAPGPADDWTGLRPGVISRMRAEADETWAARARRAFDDRHLIWVGLASTAGTFICAGAVLSMLHFASPERNDSLAA